MWLAATASGLAVFLTIYWSLTSALRTGSSAVTVGLSFAAFTGASLLVAMLVVTTACASYVAGGQPYRTDYPVGSLASQDTFLLIIIWLLLAWLPQIVLTHVPAASPERWSAIGAHTGWILANLRTGILVGAREQ